MKQKRTQVSLGLFFTTPEIETVAEFNKLAGNDTMILTIANDHIRAFDTHPATWRALETVLVDKTKVDIKTREVDKRTVRDETPKKYVERLIVDKKITLADAQAIADAIAAGTQKIPGKTENYKIEPDLAERAPAGPRVITPTKSDLTTVDVLRKHPEFIKKLANLAKRTGRDLTPKSTDNEIAIALGMHRRALVAEAAAKAKAELGL